MLYEINYKAWDFWIGLGQTIWLLGVSVYLWVTNKPRANAASIKQLESEFKNDIDEIENNIIAIKKDLEHAPTIKDIARVHERIDQVAQGLTRLEGSVASGNQTLNLIQKYLISKGDGR